MDSSYPSVGIVQLVRELEAYAPGLLVPELDATVRIDVCRERDGDAVDFACGAVVPRRE